MNYLERIVLKNVAEESKGELNTGVMKLQYAKGLTGVGENELALIIKSLQDQGYIRRLGGSNLGTVYLTALGKIGNEGP